VAEPLLGALVANLLDSLGFARVGRHVSKDLDLWQQGGIRIVVNSETSGHASRVFNVSGTNICDIGLKVSDATATIARAEALGVEPVDHPRTEEELAIPAIRGLGGSVLHFLDDELQTVWNIEFRKTVVAATNVGLTRIDHVAQTMNYDEMLSWSLFYTTLFGMQKNPMVDVIDPDGIVRSQALSTGDGAVRITLNGAETHRTLAGEFLSTRLGATVQHIALATDDIFQTAAALAERGFSAMPVNENYYVDLASRFDLDDQRLADLKAHNIFYDCDDDAEFFQLYSKPFAGAMFFEIVERRGGYKGYGAQNAPFRIAAQKRLGQPKGMPRY
jgi:4-hydroxyphenylpyruvate dioxygenase